MLPLLLHVIVAVAVAVRGYLCIRLTTLEIPAHPVAGQSVPLRCMFDMEGNELYSVKWYKGGYEFYRFLPKDDPPAQVYEAHGVQVDKVHSDQNVVTLEEISLQSSGVYRCEVSAEAPSFDTVHGEKEMTVIYLPKGDPALNGVHPKYQVGETIRINCTSYRSKPAAMLAWTINGGKVQKAQLHEYSTLVDKEGLETSTLGLEFQIKEHHFKDGEIRLSCSAAIAPVYYRHTEEVIGSSYQQAPVMESRETLSQVRGANKAATTYSDLGTTMIVIVLTIFVFI